jgi:hypothetical protein
MISPLTAAFAQKPPNSNLQAPENIQTPNRQFGCWRLELLWCLVLGFWRFWQRPPSATPDEQSFQRAKASLPEESGKDIVRDYRKMQKPEAGGQKTEVRMLTADASQPLTFNL